MNSPANFLDVAQTTSTLPWFSSSLSNSPPMTPLAPIIQTLRIVPSIQTHQRLYRIGLYKLNDHLALNYLSDSSWANFY